MAHLHAQRRRRHKAERRAIVEETLRCTRSVAEVARHHNMNANQAFQWCRLYQQCRLESDEEHPPLLPVHMATSSPAANATIELHFADARLRIKGRPDPCVFLWQVRVTFRSAAF